MAVTDSQNPLLGVTTCGSLLQQLQLIWDEVGESDEERDKMLLQLEQECLDVYKRKVEQASKTRALLLQSLADSKAELARLLSALGQKSFVGIPDKSSGTIKEQLAVIGPLLEQLCKQKEDRMREFADVQLQIEKISGEIAGTLNIGEQMRTLTVDVEDLSLKKLDEYQSQLKELQKEKLQELAAQLIDLWNLMDTQMEEQELFSHVTCNLSATVDEVTVPGALALDLIEQAEVEVERLDQLKASKMKEIAFRKQTELEDIYARAHVDINSAAARDKILALVDSGNVESSQLLAEMDNQILKAKEEAMSRKEILEKVEKWMSACEEESWLEDYNRDDNRYNSSRGAHLNLKRAEKARILVNKIPALVETLVAKIQTWEEDHGMSFMYDGVPLLAMLDEYTMLRQEREEEKRRQKDQKRMHEQLATEQESMFSSRPSPARPLGTKKVVGPRANGGPSNGTPSRRLSLNAHQGSTNGVRSVSRDGKRDGNRPAGPVNYVAIVKEDAGSHVSGTDQVPASP
ncbi:65-kDa microtubule-associated protein 1-like isoform X2 [Musa acuminata AAA Group]|uniref:65-kDa microtubule-associated protein 1-like isoform X2 n=1 Tax=Musa acuminata AAA Group TaxID=214697 RepID=UPI0031CE24B6